MRAPAALAAVLACVAVSPAASANVTRGCFPLLAPGSHASITYGGSLANASEKAKVDAIFGKTVALGSDVIQFGFRWTDLETAPGVVNATALAAALQIASSFGLKPFLNVAAIDTNNLAVPADLADPDDPSRLRDNFTWSQPPVLTRYLQMIQSVAPLAAYYGAFHIGVGNEVDGLLAGQPAVAEDFAQFVAVVGQNVRAWTTDAMSVGVTFTFGGLSAYAQEPWVSALLNASDGVPLTYYPMDSQFRVQDPSVPFADVPEMLQLLPADKCLALQEFGYPSGYMNASSTNNSTDVKQGAFFQNVFAAALAANKTEPARARVLSAFKLVDWTPDVCASLENYYHLNVPAFAEYLCTVGLVRADGSSKASLQPFLDGLADFLR